MLKEHKKVFDRIFRLNDIVIIVLSFIAAYYFRFEITDFKTFLSHTDYIIFSSSYLILWIYLSNRFKLYSSKRTTKLPYETWDITKTTMLCLTVSIIPAFLIRQYPPDRLFLIYFYLLQTGVLIFFHLNLRLILRCIRHLGYNYRNVLLIGKNIRSEKIIKEFSVVSKYGFNVVGYIDINNGHTSEYLKELESLAQFDDFEKILKENVIDLVLITLPIKSFYAAIEKVITICESVGVEVEIPAELFNLKISKSSVSTFNNVKFINYYTSPKMNWRTILKRLIDIVISLFLLILCLPLFLILSIIIKTTSSGPVFFKQRRVGFNGRIFSMLKFRTMAKDAESMKKDLMDLNVLEGPVFKIKNDPRVTKLGRFLRKASIDEIPQLINVLKGEMSLVGPRPPIPDEVAQYKIDDRRRLSMRPGLTCLWQVNGRNEIPFEEWMKLDRQYIDQWSLWLDFKILMKTIPAVFRGTGAI
jgi:exopolysaccharide biosynthesis polyprenyl glycosylphosphotransferase